MKPDNKNMLLAIALSALVLIGWQYFVGVPQMQRQQEAARQAELQKAQQPQAQQQPGATPATGGQPAAPGVVPGQAETAPLASRAEVIKSTPRISIDTPRYIGSINLKGGRLDDIALRTYHETVDPNSPNVIMLSPSGTPIRAANHHTVLENEGPYYADFGWAPTAGATIALPNAETMWKPASQGALTPSAPAVIEWDNGQGLVFRRR